MLISQVDKEKVNIATKNAKENKYNTIITPLNIKTNNKGVLTNVPVSVQDNICIKNTLTTCASKSLYNFKPPYQATVIDNILNQGAVITGKTNMSEYMTCYDSSNSFYKPFKNPNGTKKTGSSAVPATLVDQQAAVGLATDTAGEIMYSAAYAGKYVIRPTFGRVSRFGIIPLSTIFDTVCTVGNSIQDAALLLEVISTYDKKDSLSLDKKAKFTNVKENKKLVVGVIDSFEYLSKQQIENYNKTIQDLKEKGYKIKTIKTPDFKNINQLTNVLKYVEASSNLAKIDGVKFGYRSKKSATLEELYVNTRTEGFSFETKKTIMMGNYYASEENIDQVLYKAQKLENYYKDLYNKIFKDVDVIVLPTVIDAKKENDTCYYTSLASVGHAPFVFVPTVKEDGVQVLANRFEEEKAISVALSI